MYDKYWRILLDIDDGGDGGGGGGDTRIVIISNRFLFVLVLLILLSLSGADVNTCIVGNNSILPSNTTTNGHIIRCNYKVNQ